MAFKSDEYPFESNFLTLENNLKYHYLDEGEGKPVVMVHGNPSWSFYYRKLVCGLRNTHRVIVPDHIGCGLSDKPQSYDYVLKRHIDNLETLLESKKLDNITLLLHDWGGAIGMGYAVRHPEKIRKLVILNTAAFLMDRLPLRIRVCRIPIFGKIAVRCFNAFALGATYMACKKKERMTNLVRKGYLYPYNNYANRIATLKFIQDIPFSQNHPTWKTVEEIQEKLHLFKNRDMLIFWGKQDFCFNDVFLEKWKEYFPDAKIFEFQDAGHYIAEDAYEKILPELRTFLKS